MLGPYGTLRYPSPLIKPVVPISGNREIQLNLLAGVLEWRVKGTNRRIAMSKAQKGNKEKNRRRTRTKPKTHVSAYKAAQDQANPSFNPFAKKT